MSSASENYTTSSHTALRILVAEDSPLNQQVALKQLEKLGYEATAVADGAEAVAALKRERFDVILMDCQMPEISGYEATWQIRDWEKSASPDAESEGPVYVIAMTANTETDNRNKCLSAGMDDFIKKPVQLAELEAALVRALARRAGAGADDEVVDPLAIASLRQLRTAGKPDPLVELVDLFLKEAPGQLDLMDDAAAKNDPTSLARIIGASTRLKGSAVNLGARNLAALCEEIEQTAKAWTLDDVQPLIGQARESFDRVKAALEKIRDSVD